MRYESSQWTILSSLKFTLLFHYDLYFNLIAFIFKHFNFVCSSFLLCNNLISSFTFMLFTTMYFNDILHHAPTNIFCLFLIHLECLCLKWSTPTKGGIYLFTVGVCHNYSIGFLICSCLLGFCLNVHCCLPSFCLNVVFLLLIFLLQLLLEWH